ncbi:hypothetical protein ACLOJK_026840 [Asimina triloba]
MSTKLRRIAGAPYDGTPSLSKEADHGCFKNPPPVSADRQIQTDQKHGDCKRNAYTSSSINVGCVYTVQPVAISPLFNGISGNPSSISSFSCDDRRATIKCSRSTSNPNQQQASDHFTIKAAKYEQKSAEKSSSLNQVGQQGSKVSPSNQQRSRAAMFGSSEINFSKFMAAMEKLGCTQIGNKATMVNPNTVGQQGFQIRKLQKSEEAIL